MSLSISPPSAHLVLTLPTYVHQSLSTIPHTTAPYTHPGGQKQHGKPLICGGGGACAGSKKNMAAVLLMKSLPQ